MTAGDEHQRAVELVHLVQEDRHVHRPRLGHLVVVEPGAEVLVPLPHVAVEGHLAVDLELVHVDRLAEDLHHRLDHPRVARQPREGRAVHVRGEVRPHRVAALLAHVLRSALGVERRHLVGEGLDLFGREQAREEEIAVAIELLELRRGELHSVILSPASSTASG